VLFTSYKVDSPHWTSVLT